MTNQPHLECFIQTKFQLGDCRILIEKLASKIKKKGNEELDTIYRSLAYLMGLILNKRDASWKRKITAKRLMKKFGIYDDNHMINEEFPREILDHVYAYKIFYNKGFKAGKQETLEQVKKMIDEWMVENYGIHIREGIVEKLKQKLEEIGK